MIEESSLVKKGHGLVLYRGSLTALEQKIFTCAISQIQEGDKGFQKYKIETKEFMEISKLTGNSAFETLKKAAGSLMSRRVDIPHIDHAGKEKLTQTRLVLESTITKNDGTIEVLISESLMPYLLELKSYTQYNLKNVLQLKSGYSIRVYELLKKWPGKSSQKFEIEEFKKLVGATDKAYERLDNFTRRILDVVQTEITDQTDLDLTVNKKRTGRKVTHIELIYSAKDRSLEDQKEVERQWADVHVAYIEPHLENEGMSLKSLEITKAQANTLVKIAAEKATAANEDTVDYFIHYAKYAKKKRAKNIYAYMKKIMEIDGDGYVYKKKLERYTDREKAKKEDKK